MEGQVRSGPPGGAREVAYAIVERGESRPLPGVQWADWDAEGRLLVATADARLQIREYAGGALTVADEIDLRAFRPEPAPPPVEATQW